ncbi:MAG: hypothetical protein AAGD09_25735 [Cyanobacteria bacterium P01_F01_bin.56]
MPFTKENFVDGLRDLKASGTDGFEGLIARLIERLTERHFHLATSGYQEGRDISSSALNSNSIAVECKRYGASNLNVRDLQGGLTQALENILDLDIWVLVASRDVQSQADEALRQQANREGILYFAISTDDGTPSSLEILCANSIDVVSDYLGESSQLYEFNSYLQDIYNQEIFQEKVYQLRNQFLSPLVGYENWRIEQTRHFLDSLSSESKSRIEFGQPLNVNSQNVNLVNRNEAWVQLNHWIEDWGQTHKQMALLGEEGDGKTWCIASWLSYKARENSYFPPVVFLSSEKINSNEPIDLVSSYIERKNQSFNQNFNQRGWKNRINRWLNRKHNDFPLLILVLDGINERRKHQWWRRLIEKLNDKSWIKNIAILINCRKAYWQRYFSGLHYLQVSEYVLPPYSDEELAQALSFHELALHDVGEDLLHLVRKPRYFDLMIKYRERIEESGDVTIARLIYEDWQDRYQRKNLEMENQSFQEVIGNLAEKYRDENRYIRSQDVISDTLISFSDKGIVLEELSTGGILQRGISGRYFVNEHYLVYGLGLLLVDELWLYSELTEDQYSNVVAGWLEPHSEMDIKASICGFAVLHSLSLMEYPSSAKVALLNTWVNIKNPKESVAKDFISYLPVDPNSYISLSEIVWTDSIENQWAQDLLMQAFLRWKDNRKVRAELQTAFERWLGFINIYGLSSQRRVPPILGETIEDTQFQFAESIEVARNLRQEINERIGMDLEVGEQFELGVYKFTTVEDEGLLRLARVALAIISHLPRSTFMSAIVAGLLAEEFMGVKSKGNLTSWIIHTAEEPLWLLVEHEINKLLALDNPAAYRAAYRLLELEGSNLACEKQQTLPENSSSVDPFYAQIREDPCRWRFRWSKSDCEQCLLREDLHPGHLAEQLKWHAADPALDVPENLWERLAGLVMTINVDEVLIAMGPTAEDIKLENYEIALCAYAPNFIAWLVKQIFKQIGSREGMALRQLSIQLKEYSLIFQSEEYIQIFYAWQNLLELSDFWEDAEELAESFLFKEVLKILDANNQLKELLKRSDVCTDLIACEGLFLPIHDWEFISDLLSSSLTLRGIQRVTWFLSSNPAAIPIEFIRDQLIPLVQHEDGLVRSSILRILHSLGDPELARHVIEHEWIQSGNNSYVENLWGSLLVGRYAAAQSLELIKGRVSHICYGYSIQYQAIFNDVLDELTDELDHLIETIRTYSPDINFDSPFISIKSSADREKDLLMTHLKYPSNKPQAPILKFTDKYSTWGGLVGEEPQGPLPFFENSQQRDQRSDANRQILEVIEQHSESGNVWFSERIYPEALEKIILRDPGRLERWITPILSGQDSSHYLNLASSFYSSVCEALFNLGYEEEALELYKKLKSPDAFVQVRDQYTDIELIDYAFFRSQPSETIKSEWRSQLQTVKTDADFLQIVTLAWYGSGQDWLWSEVNVYLESSAMIDKIRAGMMLAFMPNDRSLEILGSYIEPQLESWIKRFLIRARELWERHTSSRHWFQEFLQADEDLQAWTSFRLFLSCVDSRFWHWLPSLESYLHDKPRKYEFFQSNIDTIKNRIRKNEKPLREHYFGHKVLQGEVWPWL